MNLFKGKKVVIMGLGLHGGGVDVTKFFIKQGADVLVTDLRSKKELKESIKKLKNVKFVLGEHREEDFVKADLIIRNPGVPRESFYLKIARKNNIPIKTDIDIFFDLYEGEIIGITGTKGKSTVATLTYLLLKKKYPQVFLAGNIGISPLTILPKKGITVLELSSFELEYLKKSPHIALITNLFPDHLNRYKSFNDYVEAKKSIFKYQKEKDILILNKDIKFKSKGKTYHFDGLNTSAATSIARIMKVSDKDIKKVLTNFKGVPHRQQFIAKKKGVEYYNDTAATNPTAVILALKTFKKRIVLIAGGEDKNLDYFDMAEEIMKRLDCLVLFPGTASVKLKGYLKDIKIYEVKSMKQAVKKASSLAKKGDMVLLSPGAASFNMFKNEFDRGEQFIKAVKSL
jgi:UDP-N-acetylmuramoylalanine--D-glutamate ligase